MKLQRVYTGLIISFLTIFFIIIGEIYYSLFVATLAGVALWEFYDIVFFNIKKKLSISFLCFFGVFNSFIMIFVLYKFGILHAFLILSFNVIVVACLTLIFFTKDPNILETAMKQFAGFFYIPLSLSFLIFIRNEESGVLYSLIFFGVIASGDIGAYYFGTYFGKYKLYPKVSPNKTIEGSILGLFCNVIFMIISKCIFLPFFDIYKLIIFSLIIGAISQIGDLFVSSFKRNLGVKDSSKILPGHGGVLDRIDGLLLALPFFYFFFVLINI